MIKMVDYKKLRKSIAITVGALAASAAILVGVQQYQKNQSQKAFEKLPKETQELIIKYKKENIPDIIIKVNIDACNEITRLGKLFDKFVEQEQKTDSIKVTNKDEITNRIFYKNGRRRILIDLYIQTANNQSRLTVLDETKAKLLSKSIEEMIAQIDAQLKELKTNH